MSEEMKVVYCEELKRTTETNKFMQLIGLLVLQNSFFLLNYEKKRVKPKKQERKEY